MSGKEDLIGFPSLSLDPPLLPSCVCLQSPFELPLKPKVSMRCTLRTTLAVRVITRLDISVPASGTKTGTKDGGIRGEGGVIRAKVLGMQSPAAAKGSADSTSGA